MSALRKVLAFAIQAGCAASEHSIVLGLRTTYEPGSEFDSIEVTVNPESIQATPLRYSAEGYVEAIVGEQVAILQGVLGTKVRVKMALLLGEETIVERTATLELRSTQTYYTFHFASGRPIDAVVDAGIDTVAEVEPIQTRFVCPIINGRDEGRPSGNDTHRRFNLSATDRGAPVILGAELNLLFGDSRAVAVLWDDGDDPDTVGHIPMSRVIANPEALCAELDFYVTADIPSIAAGPTREIERDFQSAHLTAPDGETLADYLDWPVGPLRTLYAAHAGSGEVPSGAVPAGPEAQDAYVFWAARSGRPEPGPMRSSFVAHWGGAPFLTHRILYRLDDVDGSRPLGGHFIHTAPLLKDDYVYVYGTGTGGLPGTEGIHLARVPAGAIGSRADFELYDPDRNLWFRADTVDEESRRGITASVSHTEGVVELGAQFVEDVGLFVLMYRSYPSDLGRPSTIEVAVAAQPEGPWQRAVVANPDGDSFAERHCCRFGVCEGEQFVDCNAGGIAFAALALPLVQTTPLPDGSCELSIPFLLSVLEPRNVVLLETRVRIHKG